jgi:uncharacterized protein YihD (DUF1040 family)
MTGSLLNVIRRLEVIQCLVGAMKKDDDLNLIQREIGRLIRDLQQEAGFQPVQFDD